MRKITCEYCGIQILVHDYRINARFCSNECKNKKVHTWVKRPQKITNEKEKLKRLTASFEKNVIRKEGCWDWSGSKDKDGYAVMSCRRHMGSDRGHKASWIIHKGYIPTGLHVCHHCDNPICTNPDHLWIGTNKQNNDDKMKKGRANCPLPPYKKGSEVGTSKLKDNDVIQIKKLLQTSVSVYKLADDFKVHECTICRIRDRKTWKHIEV